MACKCNQPGIQPGRTAPTGHVDRLLTALGQKPDRSRPGIYPADDLDFQAPSAGCSCNESASCGCADCQSAPTASCGCMPCSSQRTPILGPAFPSQAPSPSRLDLSPPQPTPNGFRVNPPVPSTTPNPGFDELHFRNWLQEHYPSQYQALIQCMPEVDALPEPPMERRLPNRVLPGAGPDVPVAPGLSFVHPLWDPLRGLATRPLASAQLAKQFAPIETLAAQSITPASASTREMMSLPVQSSNTPTQAIAQLAMLLRSTLNTNSPAEQRHAAMPTNSASFVTQSISKVGVTRLTADEIAGSTFHTALSNQTQFEPDHITANFNPARRKAIQSTSEPMQLRSSRIARQPIATSPTNSIYFSSGGGANQCSAPTASVTVGDAQTGFAVTGQEVKQPRWATTKMQGDTIVLNAFFAQNMQPWKVNAIVGLVWKDKTTWAGSAPFPNYLSTFYRSVRGQIVEVDQVHQLLTVKLDLTTRDASHLKEVNEYTLVADDSIAIQAALDWAHAQGGATVHIPAGTYTIGVPHTNNMNHAVHDNDLSSSQCTPEATDLEAAFRCTFQQAAARV